MENWLTIPNFRNQSTIDIVDIESYFVKLYEDKKLSLYQIYKDDVAEKMLKDYDSKLSDLKRLYSIRFNYLFNNFRRDLDEAKDKCIIKIILYGPDDHYTYEEEMILNKAFDNFCFKLSNKNYPYNIKEEQVKVDDFMDGACTVGYKILEITLK